VPTGSHVATVGSVRTTRRTAAAIGASALLLAVTACASDDSTGEPSADTPAASTVDATDQPGSDEPSGTAAAPSEADTDGDDPVATAPATDDPAVVVPDALQFTAPLVGGGTFDGAAVAGKPTAFWFWAPT
jgi:hypothetical protein